MSFDIFLPMFDPTSPFNKVQEEVLPTVDEILEKITEKGIESLTEKEKEILDNYVKQGVIVNLIPNCSAEKR